MPWFKVDDDLPNHPKARRAGPYAMGVWVLCGAWVAKNLTDGWVPEWVAREQGGRHWKRAAKSLADVGLWHPGVASPGRFMGDSWADVTALLGPGWDIHQYHERNPTRADVMAEREANSARQRALRDRRKRARNGVTQHPRNGVTQDIDGVMRNGSPVPVRPYGTSRDGTRVGNGTVGDAQTDDPSSPISTPTPPGMRDPAVESLIAQTRAKLPKGRPLRNVHTPVDPDTRGGA